MNIVAFFSGSGGDQRCIGSVIANPNHPPFRTHRNYYYFKWYDGAMADAIMRSSQRVRPKNATSAPCIGTKPVAKSSNGMGNAVAP